MSNAADNNKDAISAQDDSTMFRGWSDRRALLALTIAYIALHAAIGMMIPAYEPATQNDDWVYAMPIESALAGEGFYLHPNTGALALPQMFAGWVLCAVCGQFSYTLLRGAMVVFGLTPVLFSYLLLRQTHLSIRRSLLGAAIVLANPWLVILTWSFQTDVPFLALVLAALVFALRFDGQEKQRAWLACSVIALLLACLTRQSGIFVALSLAGYFSVNRKLIPAGLYLLLIPACMVVERYFVAQGDLTYLPYAKEVLLRELSSAPLLRSFLAGYEALHLFAVLGLCVFPILFAIFHQSRLRWISLALPIILMAGMLLLDSFTRQTIFPGNYLTLTPEPLLGPRTLAISTDPTAAVGAVRDSWSWPLRIATPLGVFAGAILIAIILRELKDMLRRVRKRSLTHQDATLISFAMLFASLFLISTFIGRRPFDKYLLGVLPLVLPTALAWLQNDRQAFRLAVPTVALLLVFSFAGVVDYWSWNAARWQALAWLQSKDVPADRIDGGYEFNGMHGTLALPPGMKRSSRHKELRSTSQQSAMDVYIVREASEHTTETEVHAVPYPSLLSWSEKRVVVTRAPQQPVAEATSTDLQRSLRKR